MPECADRNVEMRYVLPFTTLAGNRLKDFTKNMEKAAILFLAESNREKGESHILKKTDEKIVFITEAYYPIWLAPLNGATLMFDGLGITSHSLFYSAIPDIQIFNESIQENRRTTEAYTAILAENTDYFKNINGKEEKTIEGLITTVDLLEDLSTYLSRMKETKEPSEIEAALTPTIDCCDVQTNVEHLLDLRRRTEKDVEDIDASVKLLNTTTTERTKVIREEIRKTREEHDEQVEKIRPIVTKRISQIQNQYNRKIARASTRFKEKLRRLRRNQIKFQQTSRRLTTETKLCETRLRSSKRRKRKRTEKQWTLKLKRIKKKMPKINKELKKTIKEIRETEASQNLELAQMKTECDSRIEAANKPFQDLRASEEAEITMKQQEIATLQDMTAQIASQMREIGETKRSNLTDFDKLAIPRRGKARALVYMPFYLVRYEKEDKKRYVVYSPSFAGNLGTLTRMKGAIGGAKMKSLLQPRSEAITAFLDQLVARIAQNPVLEKEVTEAAIQDSILLSKKMRIDAKKGLKELKEEDWMTENELEIFSKVLYVYA